MGFFTQLLTGVSRCSPEQQAILRVLTADEMRPLEAILLRTMQTPDAAPPARGLGALKDEEPT
jgi:hypothetical protein